MIDPKSLLEGPERIYLEPCCIDPREGRQWCEDNVWPQCGDHDEPGIEYIRADLAQDNIARGEEIERLRALVSECHSFIEETCPTKSMDRGVLLLNELRAALNRDRDQS